MPGKIRFHVTWKLGGRDSLCVVVGSGEMLPKEEMVGSWPAHTHTAGTKAKKCLPPLHRIAVLPSLCAGSFSKAMCV